MNITLVNERDIGPELDKKIKDSLCLCFPDDRVAFSLSRGWHNSFPAWSLYSEESNRIISHVGVIDRNIRIGDQMVRVAGMQNIFVLPEFRGKGLCDALMKEVTKRAGELGYDYGLLFCIPVIEKVYEQCGWANLPNKRIIHVDVSGKNAYFRTRTLPCIIL